MIILNRLESLRVRQGIFWRCNLDSRKVQAVLRHLLRYLKPLIIFGKGVARCSVISLTSGKLLIQFGLMGYLYKLFSDLGVNGKLWLAIKDLYTDVKAQVLYSGALSRELDIAQGTGQERILAPFMYKVYINSLLKELSDRCFAISINTLRMPAPSFADDICLIALHQSLLKILMNKCHNYSKKWRYEFNHSKSGVVTFGETKPVHSVHCKSMKEREWALGDDTGEELYEYKNLGALKNYCCSFVSNVSDNIDKTRKKAGMLPMLTVVKQAH